MITKVNVTCVQPRCYTFIIYTHIPSFQQNLTAKSLRLENAYTGKGKLRVRNKLLNGFFFMHTCISYMYLFCDKSAIFPGVSVFSKVYYVLI